MTVCASSAPNCSCRVLPMALFLVDRDTSRAALQTFYHHARLNLRHQDLAAAADFLPPTAFPHLRYVTLFIDKMQCHLWLANNPRHGSSPPPPRESLSSLVSGYIFHRTGTRPSLTDAHTYRADFAALLARLTSASGLLELELDLQASASYHHPLDRSSDDSEQSLRWAYELYLDIAEGLCAVADRLRSVRFRLGAFRDLEPWLEREVMGPRAGRAVEGARSAGRSERMWYDRVPSWHDENRTLRAVNRDGVSE